LRDAQIGSGTERDMNRAALAHPPVSVDPERNKEIESHGKD
jgi:hypothetical protein